MNAVILMGIQASGKTTFYAQRFFDSHVRLSLDMLKTRHRMMQLLGACLRARQPFVIDNTNVRREQRKAYIVPARAAHFRVIGYFFQPDVRRAIVWNQQRGSKAIPLRGLLATVKRLERPSAEEGFDELYRVEIDRQDTFVVLPFGAPDDAPQAPTQIVSPAL